MAEEEEEEEEEDDTSFKRSINDDSTGRRYVDGDML